MSGSLAVTIRRTTYPQVDPRAAGLMGRPPVVVPPDLAIARASRLRERRRAPLVVARTRGAWAAASRETLARALALGLHRAPLTAVLWNAPLVAPGAAEVAVRRQLGPGQPFVLVGSSGRPEGAVFRDTGAASPLPFSVASQLGRLPDRVAEIVRAAGAHGGALGLRVAAVGGLVRDLLLGRADERTDLDLVVEGSAAALGHALARSLGGRVLEHRAFLTATVALPDGRRIDLATARRESYRVPGALPAVEPARLEEDLVRRDFSLNALAARLDRDAWGEIVDVTGGLADLRARRLRVLHPLSFVEDPTRIFRAARFAARLGCRVDPTTRRLAAEAAGLGIYRALSGDRLRAELELLLAEVRPVAAVREATRLGAWRLLDAPPPARAASRRLQSVRAPLAPGRRDADTAVALATLALWGDSVAIEAPMALAPSARAAVREARRDAPELARRLGGARGRAATYRMLEGVAPLTLAWARALAGPLSRARVDRHLRRGARTPALVTGDDVAALGVPPGPRIGEMLKAVRAAQAAGQFRSRAGALRLLQGIVSQAPRGDASLTRPGKRGG
jgi:tRNA nucleotidyltransferase (CCA-adding enzyme)